MSWQTINELVGLAATNREFAQELVTDPVGTVNRYGYQLTQAEQEVLRLCASQTLDEFSQKLLHHLSALGEDCTNNPKT